MSYTVGVKRKFWFGYNKYRVKTHAWENFRFILNLDDGEQMHVPGFLVPAFKVYADFWTHYAQQRAATVPVMPASIPIPVQAEAPRQAERQGAIAKQEPQPKEEEYVEPTREDLISQEAKSRAAERVRGILKGQEFEGALGSRPN